jgi:phosphatidylglycerol lysyltransferase
MPTDPPAETTEAAAPTATTSGRITKWIGPVAILAVLAAAGWVLHNELRVVHYRDLIHEFGKVPRTRIVESLLLALAAHAVLPGYDFIALRATGKPIATHRIVFSAFIAYSLSQTLGFPLLTGGSVRYRFWSAWGLDASEIATAMSYVAATFTIGMLLVVGAVLVAEPAGTAELLRLPIPSLWPVGVACLMLVAVYLARSLMQRRPLAWRGFVLPVPPFRVAVVQLLVATLDWALAAGVLYVLLPPGHQLSYPMVLGGFMIAQFAGIVSHVPGGLGVFEGLVVLMLRPYLDAGPVLSALLMFRVIYYLLPFAIGGLMLGAWEAIRQGTGVARAVKRVGWVTNLVAARWLPSLLPYILGGAAFMAGVILLVSGATPPVHSRIRFLNDLLPLGIIEVSHFIGSLAGGALMILGWALTRRLDAAYRLTQGLLVVGMAASLLKGLDWEEALVLSAVFILLLPARQQFYRRSALTAEPLSPNWIIAIAVTLGFTVWLGYFSYKHLDYSSELWWRFTLGGDAPRHLRALVGVMVPLATFAFARLVRHAPTRAPLPTRAELESLAPIVREASSATANLVLLGDKSVLRSESGKGFIMYGVAGRSWVSMGDPIGPAAEQRELAWTFRELADQYGGWTVFYEVSSHHLSLYIDLGLTLLKIGEEAIVPLADFSLEGSHRRGVRRSYRDSVAAGAQFAMEPVERVPALLPELAAVSDQWLAAKQSREKGFSLGLFDPEYLAWFPIATARVDGRLVAFANMWCAPAGGELSMDLMRYSNAAPDGVMTFLFVEMMLWGKANGYRTFNLGMAPLSGLESRALAPLWTRAAAFLSQHGESIYHFQGLRRFKDKFAPVWQPRYIATPAGLALPRILTNIASLISGGLTGALRK